MIGKMVHMAKTDSSINTGFQVILAPKIREYNEHIIISCTPRQFLIDSYPTKVIKHMSNMAGIDRPDHFSLMNSRNNSDRGVWTVFTGKSNPSMTGIIKAWNNQTELKCWRGEPCDQVRGSEGAFFAPPITPEKKLSIFTPELNTTMIGTFSHSFYEDSLEKYRFTVFENQFTNRDNSCYCARTEEIDKYCYLDGLIDLYDCTDGLPFLMSKPHFYNSESTLYNRMNIGLSPNKTLHESFMDVDPYLGVVSGVKMRMQLNIDMAPIKRLS